MACGLRHASHGDWLNAATMYATYLFAVHITGLDYTTAVHIFALAVMITIAVVIVPLAFRLTWITRLLKPTRA